MWHEVRVAYRAYYNEVFLICTQREKLRRANGAYMPAPIKPTPAMPASRLQYQCVRDLFDTIAGCLSLVAPRRFHLLVR